jgi:anti-anti-sigma factor
MSRLRQPQSDANRILVHRHARLGFCQVRLEGEHDLATAPELRETLLGVRPSEILVVDLTACGFIDSSVIAQLLAAQRRHPDLRVVVADETCVVARALRLTGVWAFLHTTTNREPLLMTE